MYSSRSSTPDLGYSKLPPIITTEADREFLNEINAFIDSELGEINHLKEEERYLVFKTVFNRVIEHVTAYKPVLVQIKKEYEDTIETIKKGQREAIFLQEKLKAMASEPSTLRNYRKRADELEERIFSLRKKNEQFQQELTQMRLVKEEKENRPKTAETPERLLKKDSRLIPGLSIEETTDMKVLQKKYESLDRQIKELSLSLRARFLPKTHKLQLKESLDNKVTYRDRLLWQSQVYKARGQKLKIALEAAQAYNQMKPPHQTVGDAVIIAFQQASGMLKAEREKTEGEQADPSQATTFEDDDPNKEKEAEMMLEYIEKFNELFEDGLYEEAAVHAANSPKGILRTQATLAKFRDVKVKFKGRSPLLAFCDSLMSSVRAAGSRPNEALSLDCMEACLNENRLDLAYHWLSQDRLTQSVGLAQIISKHCTCPPPCKCGCQALAQSVFTKLKCHQDVVVSLFKQGKIQAALQYGKYRQCINDENIAVLLNEVCDQNFLNGLVEGDLNGNKLLPDLSFGFLLLTLVERNKTDLAANLVHTVLKQSPADEDATSLPLSLQAAVMSDLKTKAHEWMLVVEALNDAGHPDIMFQLLAMTFVVDAMRKAWKTAEEEEKEVPFFTEKESVCENKDTDEESLNDKEKHDENGKESSAGLSSRSHNTLSIDNSSRETSPEHPDYGVAMKESVVKKKTFNRRNEPQAESFMESTPTKTGVKKRVVKIPKNKDELSDQSDDNFREEKDDGSEKKKRVKMNISPSIFECEKIQNEESKVHFQDNPVDESQPKHSEILRKAKRQKVSFGDMSNVEQSQEFDNSDRTSEKSGVKSDLKCEEKAVCEGEANIAFGNIAEENETCKETNSGTDDKTGYESEIKTKDDTIGENLDDKNIDMSIRQGTRDQFGEATIDKKEQENVAEMLQETQVRKEEDD